MIGTKIIVRVSYNTRRLDLGDGSFRRSISTVTVAEEEGCKRGIHPMLRSCLGPKEEDGDGGGTATYLHGDAEGGVGAT